MSELYKVVRTTEGYAEDHTTDLSYEEAKEVMIDLSVFLDDDYEIVQQWEHTPEPEFRFIPHGAADGWEDIYP